LSRVALFFLVSGAVMVVASGRFFEAPGGWHRFVLRRLIRILPAYWLASLLFAGWKVFRGQELNWAHLGYSLALIPFGGDPGSGFPKPFLWPAWTLFFEVLFYAAFAAALFRPRDQAVLLCSALLLLLAGVGLLADFSNPVLFMATRPVVLLFIVGMVLGLGLIREIRLAAAIRWLALAAALGLLVFAPDLSTGRGAAPLGLMATIGIGIPATLVAVAVMAGPLPLPAPRLINHLGNISYSIFLLHVPIASFWIWFYQKAAPDPGPWAFLASSLALTLIASHFSYRHFERPVTDWLNARLLRPASRPAS
jgi:exopolysaccharide production protein ExoZ